MYYDRKLRDFGHEASIAVVAFIFLLLVFIMRDVPLISPDEIGFLGSARFISSGSPLNMGTSALYPFGVSAFWIPAFLVSEDARTIYRLVIASNALMVALTVPLMIWIAEELGVRRSGELLVSALVVSVWPNYLQPASMAWSESAFRAVFMVFALFTFRYGRTLARFDLICLCVAACIAAWIHNRGLAIAPLVAAMAAVLAARGKVGWSHVVTAIGAMVAFYLVGKVAQGKVTSSLWETNSGFQGLGYLVSQISAKGSVERFVLSLSGHAWYQIVSTLGLVLVGAFYGLKIASKGSLPALTCLLAVASVFCASLVQMHVFYRADHLIYGRYADGACIVLFWFGVVAAFDKREKSWGWPLLASLALMWVLSKVTSLGSTSFPLKPSVPVTIPGLLPFDWFCERLRLVNGIAALDYRFSMFVLAPTIVSVLILVLLFAKKSKWLMFLVLLVFSIPVNWIDIWYVNASTEIERERLGADIAVMAARKTDVVVFDRSLERKTSIYKMEFALPEIDVDMSDSFDEVPHGATWLTAASDVQAECLGVLSDGIYVYAKTGITKTCPAHGG